jgi:hypothetical protein
MVGGGEERETLIYMSSIKTNVHYEYVPPPQSVKQSIFKVLKHVTAVHLMKKTACLAEP